MAFFLHLTSPIDGSGVGGGGTAGIDAGLRVFRPTASKSGENPAPAQNRKFPVLRKILLPIFVILIVVLILVLHLLQFPAFSSPSSSSSPSLGVDPLLVAQDAIFAFAVLVVLLIAILMPWERAILLPVEKKCRHQCQVVCGCGCC